MDAALFDNLRLELRRGAVVVAVLAALRTEQYGYTLRKALAEHGMAIDEGTLYPLLRRLETQGLLVSEWREADKRNKRFYRLSAEGSEILKQLVAEWKGIDSSLDRNFEGETPWTFSVVTYRQLSSGCPGNRSRTSSRSCRKTSARRSRTRKPSWAGRLVQAELEAILTRWGHPMLVAERYLPQRSLIGPVLLPAYKLVLTIVTLVYLVPWLLVLLGFVIFDPARRTPDAIGDGLQAFWLIALHLVVVVTGDIRGPGTAPGQIPIVGERGARGSCSSVNLRATRTRSHARNRSRSWSWVSSWSGGG